MATFVGNANILKGTAQETEADILKVSLAGSIVSAVAEGKKIAPGTPVTLAVRSENMIFDETCQSGMEAVVVEKSFDGFLFSYPGSCTSSSISDTRFLISAFG